jgi:hypothetical protein
MFGLAWQVARPERPVTVAKPEAAMIRAALAAREFGVND